MSSVTGKNVICSYGKFQPGRAGWNSRNGNKTVSLEDLSVVIIVGKQIKRLMPLAARWRNRSHKSSN